MPTIIAFIREGNPAEVKRTLVKKITDVVVETIPGMTADRIVIQLIEQSTDNYARGGVLKMDQK